MFFSVHQLKREILCRDWEIVDGGVGIWERDYEFYEYMVSFVDKCGIVLIWNSH